MKLETKHIGVVIALVLGVMMLFLPTQDASTYRFQPEELAKQITENQDQLDPGTLSQWIIEGRRDYRLIDIRSEKEFNTGHIKGAENIPMEELLKKSTIDELTDEKLMVLYSNGSSHAGQAWLVMKTAGFDSYVLEGGFNYWNKIILNPKAPTGEVSDDEILRYSSQLAIKSYFGGGGTEAGNVAPTVKKKTIIRRPKRKKKKLKGC
ncbi:MAG: rhodanese-like domain-containing protein [bacterium]|nr:rhodanese-like domain-containing protein [bacterium]